MKTGSLHVHFRPSLLLLHIFFLIFFLFFFLIFPVSPLCQYRELMCSIVSLFKRQKTWYKRHLNKRWCIVWFFECLNTNWIHNSALFNFKIFWLTQAKRIPKNQNTYIQNQYKNIHYKMKWKPQQFTSVVTKMMTVWIAAAWLLIIKIPCILVIANT